MCFIDFEFDFTYFTNNLFQSKLSDIEILTVLPSAVRKSYAFPRSFHHCTAVRLSLAALFER